MTKKKILRTLLLLVLLAWTATIFWTLLQDPLGESSSILPSALLCTAGFILLARHHS